MMDRRTAKYLACCLVAALSPSVFAGPVHKGSSLVSAVPSNVFLCTTRQHNPERAFIDAYWNEVHDAFKATGAVTDLLEMVSSFLGDGQQAELDRIKTLAIDLASRVDWCGLGSSEFVFAERMGGIRESDHSVHIGPPEMLFLMRGDAGTAQANFNGLVSIAEALSKEINNAAGSQVVAVTRHERSGVPTVVLGPNDDFGLPDELKFFMTQLDGVIVVSMAPAMFDESVALLQGRSASKSLMASKRYKAAFAGLPSGTDGHTFFDMQRLIKPVTGAVSMAISRKGRQIGNQVAGLYGGRNGSAIDADAMSAYGKKDYKKALELIHIAAKAAPDDSRVMYNVACFEALNGNKEEALKWLERSVDAGFLDPRKIAKDSDLKSLRNDERFARCLRKAKAGMEKLAEGEQSGPGQNAAIKKLVDRIAGVPGIVDYTAVVESTVGNKTVVEALVKLVPDARSNPVYPVFGNRDSLENYQRFVPAEATSFSVSGGLDLTALYKFVEDSIRMVGDGGEQVLAQWAGLQQQVNFNLKDDLLSWLVGDSVSVAFKQGGEDQWVFMIRVSDEAAASAKVDTVLQHAAAAMQQAAVKNPMLGMMAIRSTPATHPKLAGFHAVQVGMSPKPMACGVAKGYIMVGSSQDAVATCLATAAGDHPNITTNKRVMDEAVLPNGAFRSLSFKDDRNFGKDLSQLLAAIPMIGGMATMGIPDPAVRDALTRVMGIVAKLSPVAAKIDFYQSSGSCSTFDGGAWHTRSVVNYVSPSERSANAATASR